MDLLVQFVCDNFYQSWSCCIKNISHVLSQGKKESFEYEDRRDFTDSPLLQVVNKTDISVSVVKVYHGVDKSQYKLYNVLCSPSIRYQIFNQQL